MALSKTENKQTVRRQVSAFPGQEHGVGLRLRLPRVPASDEHFSDDGPAHHRQPPDGREAGVSAERVHLLAAVARASAFPKRSGR